MTRCEGVSRCHSLTVLLRASFLLEDEVGDDSLNFYFKSHKAVQNISKMETRVQVNDVNL